jgi:DNA-directed RNA polymerase I, II, and III subunit RPABC2
MSVLEKYRLQNEPFENLGRLMWGENNSMQYRSEELSSQKKFELVKNGIIIDDLHKTIPYLTKYEKARILGLRAKQINSGASVFVSVPEKVIDGYLIAELELQEKRIPFIIRRPLPNGGSEYWSIKDLENISF